MDGKGQSLIFNSTPFYWLIFSQIVKRAFKYFA